MRLILIALLLVPLALAAADVTGKWDFTVELDAGSGNPTFTFKQDGEKLSGTYAGQLGQAPVTGTVRGDQIEFKFELKSDVGELTATFTGSVTDDTMKGKCVYSQLGSGTFAGKRSR